MIGSVDARALLPLLILGYGATVLLVVSAFLRRPAAIAALSLATLAAAFVSIFAARAEAPREVAGLLAIDGVSLFWMGLLFAAGFATILIARDYFRGRAEREDRFHILVLFAVLGMAVAAASMHFATFFLGLETLTVSLYGLVGFTRLRRASLEAAIKYLVLAAASSAFLLYGIALLYAGSGHLDFAGLGRSFEEAGGMNGLARIGLALVIVGFGFKLAFVPFHMWSPDVYQGAPPPATALIASGSKGAIFALLFRLASDLDLASDPPARLLLTALCVATMFGGNLLALRQRNLRRLLAYSSIAHMGYLTIPLLAGGEVGFGAFGFYLVSYFATILAAFGVIAVLSTPGREVQEIEDLRGLGRERPLAGFVLALAMVSLVGIPLTAGFVAKFYIFGAGVRAGLWTLVLLAVVASGISAYYYVRVLVTLYATREAGAAAPAALAQRPSSPWAWAAILALALVVLFFGIYPAPLIALASGAMGMGAPMAGW